MIKVSVIVPVYRVEAYLPRCVESIRTQSADEWEMILVDDGSPDGCPALCDAWAAEDPRIRVIHRKNGGLSAARNSGIAVAQGEWLLFVDSDDYIEKDLLAQLLWIAEMTDAKAVVSGFTSREDQLTPGLTERYETFEAEDAIREILLERKFHTSAWGKLFRAELFRDIRFPEGRIYEDYATIYKLFCAAEQVAWVDVRKYYYTMSNKESLTKGAFSPSQMDYILASEEIQDFLRERFPELVPAAQDRDTSNGLFLLDKYCASSTRDPDTEKRLISFIRNNGSHFQRSAYPVKKKIVYAMLGIAPSLTVKLLRKH